MPVLPPRSFGGGSVLEVDLVRALHSNVAIAAPMVITFLALSASLVALANKN